MRWPVLLVVAAAGAVLYLVCGGENDRDPGSTSERQGEPATGMMLPAGREEARPRPDVAPALPDGRHRVVLDGGPRHPGEEYGRYTRRVELARQFEEFRKEAELTDEQAQAVLLALYDYQRNRDALMETATGYGAAGQWEPILQEYLDVFFARRDAVLEPWQRSVWTDVCRYCMIYASEGILRVESAPPR